MGTLKQKNSSLLEKQKELSLQVITLQKGKEESSLIYSTLNEKLSQALAKAEMVPALQIENNEFNARIEKVRKEGETYKAELSKTKTNLETTKKQLEEAIKKQAEIAANVSA